MLERTTEMTAEEARLFDYLEDLSDEELEHIALLSLMTPNTGEW